MIGGLWELYVAFRQLFFCVLRIHSHSWRARADFIASMISIGQTVDYNEIAGVHKFCFAVLDGFTAVVGLFYSSSSTTPLLGRTKCHLSSGGDMEIRHIPARLLFFPSGRYDIRALQTHMTDVQVPYRWERKSGLIDELPLHV